MPDRMSMMVARITPHCLKQKGMAKMLTPGKKIKKFDHNESRPTNDGVGQRDGGGDCHDADREG